MKFFSFSVYLLLFVSSIAISSCNQEVIIDCEHLISSEVEQALYEHGENGLGDAVKDFLDTKGAIYRISCGNTINSCRLNYGVSYFDGYSPNNITEKPGIVKLDNTNITSITSSGSPYAPTDNLSSLGPIFGQSHTLKQYNIGGDNIINQFTIRLPLPFCANNANTTVTKNANNYSISWPPDPSGGKVHILIRSSRLYNQGMTNSVFKIITVDDNGSFVLNDQELNEINSGQYFLLQLVRTAHALHEDERMPGRMNLFLGLASTTKLLKK